MNYNQQGDENVKKYEVTLVFDLISNNDELNKNFIRNTLKDAGLDEYIKRDEIKEI